MKLELGKAAPLSTATPDSRDTANFRASIPTTALSGPRLCCGQGRSGVETSSEDWPGFPEADYVVIVSGDYDFDVTLSYRDHERLLETIRTIHTIAGVVRYPDHHGSKEGEVQAGEHEPAA
ncbi:MAG: hypothetical protein OXC09_04915 [Truepera sp.]|nr:hypothetical protein [Truepera sp.]